MLIVSLTGESLRRTDLSFVLQCIFLPLTRPCDGHLTKCLNSWVFGFEFGFHGHVGPCRICCLGSDIFLVVYIYIDIYTCVDYAANLLLQVAAGIILCFVLFWCLASDFG